MGHWSTWRIGGLLACLGLLAAAADGEGGEVKPLSVPWDRVAGLDVQDYREQFVAQVAAELGKHQSYGRCSASIAECLRRDPPHRTARRLARDVFNLMATGKGSADVAAWIGARRGSAHPERRCQIDLDGLEALGDKNAPVQVVEFADFQCPMCARLAPMLKRAVEASQGKARLYFKQFPVKSHPQAVIAAKAALAAGHLGRFWPYADLVFEHRKQLSEQTLLGLAGKVGLDPIQLGKHMQSEQIRTRLRAQKMEGIRCDIRATPTLFVNGKRFLLFALEANPQVIGDRIEEELDILRGQD